MNKILRERIEEILPKESAHYYTDALLSLFEEMGNKVIGKDDTTDLSKATNQAYPYRLQDQLFINKIKAEQRIKLKELLGK